MKIRILGFACALLLSAAACSTGTPSAPVTPTIPIPGESDGHEPTPPKP